jgi:ribonucleotide reductase beta subunit family protein with ferritin-like domain
MDSRSQNAVIAELYNEMRKYMEKGAELMPVFLKMLESFRFVIIS